MKSKQIKPKPRLNGGKSSANAKAETLRRREIRRAKGKSSR